MKRITGFGYQLMPADQMFWSPPRMPPTGVATFAEAGVVVEVEIAVAGREFPRAEAALVEREGSVRVWAGRKHRFRGGRAWPRRSAPSSPGDTSHRSSDRRSVLARRRQRRNRNSRPGRRSSCSCPRLRHPIASSCRRRWLPVSIRRIALAVDIELRPLAQAQRSAANWDPPRCRRA